MSNSPRPSCKVLRSRDIPRDFRAGRVSGITAESVGAQGIAMGVFEMAPGAVETPVHCHEHETAVYVLHGVLGVVHGDALEHYDEAGAGDMFFVPAGMPHFALNGRQDGPVTFVASRNSAASVGSAIPLADLEKARVEGRHAKR